MSDYKPDLRPFDPTHAIEYGEWGVHCVVCGAMLSGALRDPCSKADKGMGKCFDVSGEGLYQHEIGNANCQEGWCSGGGGFPHPCRCGGLIHADFGDEDWDDYWLYRKCDRCGADFEAAGKESSKLQESDISGI